MYERLHLTADEVNEEIRESTSNFTASKIQDRQNALLDAMLQDWLILYSTLSREKSALPNSQFLLSPNKRILHSRLILHCELVLT